ncbi:MAG: FtsX-like permease family protein [Phycisphaerales bacterium]|nr:FtsX-like permease family protein [Phycisphaerales bacterium]
MQRWWQIATRNWRIKPARSLLAILSITLGVGVVVWVTCCYESVRLGVTEVVLQWIGRSHVIIETSAGVWGVFEEDVEDLIREVPGIKHTTVRTREYVNIAPAASDPALLPADEDYTLIEVSGIVPDKERLFRTHKLAEGRFLKPTDENAVIIERLIAKQFKLGLGDTVFLHYRGARSPPKRFNIIGITERRRASVNQAMMTWTRLEDVQALCELPGMVKAVDIILTDPNVENIQRIADTIRGILDENRQQPDDDEIRYSELQVKTTEAQNKKLGAAQGLLQFIMMLLSCVVLLTAFFIIMATMSMGVMERIAEFGLLRCVGMTRQQLSVLVLLQTIPLGVMGTLLGVPLGLVLQWLTIRAVPDYLGQFAYNTWGIALAVFGGIGTTLLGAAVPAIRAFDVSPVEATRAAGDPRRNRWVWLLAGLGVTMLIVHELVNRSMAEKASAMFDAQAIVSLVLLYLGCAFAAPLVVMSLGNVVVAVAARLLGLRPQLLGDEIAKAPFRSAAICCGLMVGLSLIVGLVVWGESVKEGWKFPKEFPDALLYSYEGIPLNKIRKLRNVEGVAEFTVTDDFGFSLKPPSKNPLLKRLAMLDQFSRFMAIDPEEGFSIVKLAFLEGDEREAMARMKKGGHLLVTREFAQAHKKGLDDELTIWVGKTKATFTIAGVIASPGLDIAISFFNAGTHFQTYAVRAIFGTLDDANRLFGRERGKLVLFNFDFDEDEESRIVSESTQTTMGPTMTNKEGRPTFALGAGPIPGDGPEEQVVNEMLRLIDYPTKAFVTARELKQQIDRNINRVTLLLSAIPVVGLLIAALGLGNLMAANVASRSREMAILRAIGVTKNQMSRIVIGEALVLALLGSAMGLVLGLVLGRTSNVMTELLSGFRPEFAIPWDLVGYGAGLATLLCVLAAVIPARYASRSNIIAALSDL